MTSLMTTTESRLEYIAAQANSDGPPKWADAKSSLLTLLMELDAQRRLSGSIKRVTIDQAIEACNKNRVKMTDWDNADWINFGVSRASDALLAMRCDCHMHEHQVCDICQGVDGQKPLTRCEATAGILGDARCELPNGHDDDHVVVSTRGKYTWRAYGGQL